jgi:hypothetical protein
MVWVLILAQTIAAQKPHVRVSGAACQQASLTHSRRAYEDILREFREGW